MAGTRLTEVTPTTVVDALLLHSVACCVLTRCARQHPDVSFRAAARPFTCLARLEGVDRDVARMARALAARFEALDDVGQGEGRQPTRGAMP